MIQFAEKIKEALGLDDKGERQISDRLLRRQQGLDSGPRKVAKQKGSDHRYVARRQRRVRASHQRKATARYRRKTFTVQNDRQNAIGMAQVWFNPELLGTPIFNNVRAGLQATARTLAEQQGVSYETAFYSVEQELRALHDEVTAT